MAHVDSRQKIVAAVSAFVAFLFYLTLVTRANDHTFVATDVLREILDDPEQNWDGQGDRDTEGETYLYTWLQLVRFDAIEGVATMRIFPFPGDSWGQTRWSSFTTDRTFTVDVDSAGGRPIGEDSGNCSTYQADFVYGACDYILDAPNRQDLGTKSISYYPFDKYVIPLEIETRIGEGKVYADEENWDVLPIRPVEYTGRVGDFQTSWALTDYDRNEMKSSSEAYSFLNEGGLAIDITATRSASTKLIAVVLMIFIFGAAAMLATMAWSVYVGHRPPTLGSLIWGAATIFTLLQSRQDIFPSNPPIGVFMDLWFFFPSLFVSLLSTAVLFALWIRRSDWVT